MTHYLSVSVLSSYCARTSEYLWTEEIKEINTGDKIREISNPRIIQLLTPSLPPLRVLKNWKKSGEPRGYMQGSYADVIREQTVEK